MATTVEIDKAGRLVVPKRLRDALHLVPGTRLSVHQEGGRLIIEHETKPRGLYMKDGILIYDHGTRLPPDHVDWLQQSRDERAEELWMLGQKK